MNLLGLLDHLLNFAYPAVALGLLVAAVAPLVKSNRVPRSWLRQGSINSAVGLVALLLGLLAFGRDGKMASYAAMVLACASSQWLASQAG